MIRRFDRQAEFAGTRAVEAAHEIDHRGLAGYLARNIAGFAGPPVIEQFKGGQSNPTYLVRAPSGSYVVRRKPRGRLLRSAHAVEREYRVTRALHGAGFPVAAPLALCTDESVIGSTFYVMEFVPGRIFWEPHAPGLGAVDRKRLFHALNETIARLHGFDVAALGLADFGRPDGYVKRQIERWSEQYAQSRTARIAEMDRLMAWLPDAVPEQTQACLIHGDFRLDNCIVDPGEARIAAVLDWELSTIGDPIADFTYHIMQWHMPGSADGGGVGSLAGFETKVRGLPRLEDYVAEYCRRRNLECLPDPDIYLAYNFFRLAAIFQGIAGRVRDGTAVNPNAAMLAGQVRPMAERAWQFAKAAGA
jgi:aminoglycoside phosphotransferase (APT) family kinase protein